MSDGLYEILALAARYFFAGLFLLIVLRAWRVTVRDARRAGTAVLASAHAAGFAEAARRPALREMLEMGAFDMVALIDGGLGRLAALKPWEGCA